MVKLFSVPSRLVKNVCLNSLSEKELNNGLPYHQGAQELLL